MSTTAKIIPKENFQILTSPEFNLKYCAISDSLDSYSTWNIFSIIAIFFNREKFNSKNICNNIEATIDELNRTNKPLGVWESAIATKNLKAMQESFGRSTDADKAKYCQDRIDIIIAKINLKPAHQAPTPPPAVSPTVTPPSSPRRRKKMGFQFSPEAQRRDLSQVTPQPIQRASVGSTPPRTDQKAKSVAQTVTQTVTPSTPKAVQNAQKQDRNRANEALVKAISQFNKQTVTTTVKSVQIVPNMQRIDEIEKDITNTDRKLHNFTRHLIYYPHDGKCYFNALKVTNQNGFRTCKQILVRAQEVEEQVKVIKESGSNDVGARLREQMKQMGIGYKEK